MSIHRKKKDPSLPRGITRRASPTGETYFRVRVSYEMRQYELGPYMSLGDAKAALEIARGQIVRGTFIPPRERRARLKAQRAAANTVRLTVREWSDTWMDNLARAGRTPATLRTHRSVLKAHILPALGDVPIADVTPLQIEALVQAAKTPAVARNIARTCRSLFLAAVAEEAGGLTESPVKVPIPKPKTRRTNEDLATAAQVREIADKMPGRLQLAPLLACWACLRQGEVLGLQRRDFANLDTPDEATVTITRQWQAKAQPPSYGPPKAGSEGVVALPPALVPYVRAHLEKYVAAAPTSPLFPSTTLRNRPIGSSLLDSAWRKARQTISPDLHFHDLRHVGLTEYARLGATTAELMARGRHHSSEVAQRYQHATLERDRALTARLDTGLEG